MKKITLGKKVVVSDPCYEIPTWCQAVIDNVEPGEYECDVEKTDEGEWGNRCAVLRVIKLDSSHKDEDWEFYPADIGVDSGQCGVFDFDTYRRDSIVPEMEDVENETGENWNYIGWKEEGEKWYGKICEYTLFPECSHGGYKNGYVSSSGYGDGCYPLYVTRNKNGKIDGFMIIFISDDEEEHNKDDDDF
jgi:hypothetical protein